MSNMKRNKKFIKKTRMLSSKPVHEHYLELKLIHSTPSSLAFAITDHPLFYKAHSNHVNDNIRVKREPFDKHFLAIKKSIPWFKCIGLIYTCKTSNNLRP